MIKVTGKAIVELHYSVDLDVDDISDDAMSLYESDKLIRDAIYDKYGEVVDSITVSKWGQVESSLDKVREG